MTWRGGVPACSEAVREELEEGANERELRMKGDGVRGSEQATSLLPLACISFISNERFCWRWRRLGAECDADRVVALLEDGGHYCPLAKRTIEQCCCK